MTDYLSHRTVVAALLLYLSVWLCMPTEFIPLIISRYDDGGEVYHTEFKRNADYVASLLDILGLCQGLPLELHQTPPDYFLLVDTGANVHVVWEIILLAYAQERNTHVQWGGLSATSACIAIGHLFATVFALTFDDSAWHKIIVNSGDLDTWVVPDSGKQILSLSRLIAQGHVPHLHGSTPGILISGTQHYLPFIKSADGIFMYFPCYPPPTESNLITNPFYPKSMLVVNLQHFKQLAPVPDIAWAAPISAHSLSKATRSLKKKIARMKKPGSKSPIHKKVKQKSFKRNGAALIDKVHKKCAHVDMKRIMRFYKNGHLIADLPPGFDRAYRKTCATCLAMKRRKPPKSGIPRGITSGLLPWEHTYVDSSGKWRTASALGNHYYAIFVCALRGSRIFLPYRKRSQFQLIYLKFVARIGSHPKVLYSDLAAEQTSNQFERMLVMKGTRHITCAKDEHHYIGVAEKAIQDTDTAIKTTLADSFLPRRFWDIIGEHVNLILMMTSPSRCDPNITIFEATYHKIPNLDLLPRVGCFAVRIESRSDRQDQKLDPRNRPGGILRFCHTQEYLRCRTPVWLITCFGTI